MPVPVYIKGISIKDETAHAKGAYGIYWTDDTPKHFVEYVLFDTHDHRAQLHAAIRALELASERKVSDIILYTKLKYLTDVLADMETERLAQNGWKDKDAENGWKDKDGQLVENKDLLEKLHELKNNVHFIVLTPPKDMTRVQTMVHNLSTFFNKIIHH
uniref:RNase H type-1 domain-containing protein n=1 Tax=Panagrolaimus sp. JU765 TaxID=591449 RepID=A0AC34R5V8_9BILA